MLHNKITELPNERVERDPHQTYFKRHDDAKKPTFTSTAVFVNYELELPRKKIIFQAWVGLLSVN